jgi:hypothetical protein
MLPYRVKKGRSGTSQSARVATEVPLMRVEYFISTHIQARVGRPHRCPNTAGGRQPLPIISGFAAASR